MKTDYNNSLLFGIKWKTFEQIVIKIISTAISIVLARILSPDLYGQVALIQIFISFADIFATSGFYSSLIQKKDVKEIDFSSSFYSCLGISIAIYIVLFYISPTIANLYHKNELILIFRVFSIKIILSSYNSIQNAYATRKKEFKKMFISSTISNMLSGIVGIIMAFNNYGAWSLIVQSISATFINIICMHILVSWKPKFIYSLPITKSLFNYGWKILLADFSGAVFQNIRSLIIGKFYTTSDLALYNKGQQISKFLCDNANLIISPVTFTLFSDIQDNKNEIKKILRRITKMTSYICLPIMIGIIITSKDLVTFLLTEKWINTAIFIQIMGIGYTFDIFGISYLQSLKAIGKSDSVLKAEIYKKPLYILLLLFSIKQGVIAIAIAMSIYDIYGTIFTSFQVRKHINYSFKEQATDILPQLILSFIMGFVVIVFKPKTINIFIRLITQIIIGIITYVIISIITKNKQFRLIVVEIKKKVANVRNSKKNC